jgi:hypothetical protein
MKRLLLSLLVLIGACKFSPSDAGGGDDSGRGARVWRCEDSESRYSANVYKDGSAFEVVVSDGETSRKREFKSLVHRRDTSYDIYSSEDFSLSIERESNVSDVHDSLIEVMSGAFEPLPEAEFELVCWQ